jgi:hypothetical protein
LLPTKNAATRVPKRRAPGKPGLATAGAAPRRPEIKSTTESTTAAGKEASPKRKDLPGASSALRAAAESGLGTTTAASTLQATKSAEARIQPTTPSMSRPRGRRSPYSLVSKSPAYGVLVALDLTAPTLQIPGHGSPLVQVHLPVLDVDIAAHARIHAHIPEAGVHLTGDRRAPPLWSPSPAVHASLDGSVDGHVSNAEWTSPGTAPFTVTSPNAVKTRPPPLPARWSRPPKSTALEGVGRGRGKDGHETQYHHGERQQRPDIYPGRGATEGFMPRGRAGGIRTGTPRL